MVELDRNTRHQSELPPPRFDAHAHLKAQPVTPIPKSRLAVLFERAGQLFTTSSRSLALIVALGVATGTLIGMALVGDRSPVAGSQERAAILNDADDTQPLEAAEVGVYGIQTSRANMRRPAGRRSRVQTDGRTRAYRFAVIR
jgi:hypothetical protein